MLTHASVEQPPADPAAVLLDAARMARDARLCLESQERIIRRLRTHRALLAAAVVLLLLWRAA